MHPPDPGGPDLTRNPLGWAIGQMGEGGSVPESGATSGVSSAGICDRSVQGNLQAEAWGPQRPHSLEQNLPLTSGCKEGQPLPTRQRAQ